MAMEMTKTLAWGGAAVLTTSFFVFLMWPREEAAPKAVAEANLFAFIQPMSSNPQASAGGVPAAAARPRTPPGASAAEQALAYAGEQPALRDVPDATSKMAAVQDAAQRMRREGASEDEVYRMRAAELSPDAAAQLANMERDENAWKARVDAYLAERDKLLGGNSGMYPEETLQQLRNARFTLDEQKRLAAYESGAAPQLTLE